MSAINAAQRWREVKQILSAALELDPPKRSAFLLTACSGDASLLQEVQSLLDAYDQGDSLLDQSPSISLGLTSGTRLGNYEIEGLIGSGGMGEVYRATDVTLGLDVAIKVLRPGFSADPVRLIRLEQEARSAAALNHPNILYVHRLDTHEGLVYIVSEFLEGKTLRERLQQGQLPMNEVANYASQAALGLAAAHAKGIIHRDIKPENLFVTKYGQVKVLDFGLAKVAETFHSKASGSGRARGVQLTAPGALLGTAAYMSPDQLRGRDIGPPSDVFSFGVVLYEMATGVRPFQGETFAVVSEAVMNRSPVPPSTLNPAIEVGFEQVILRALEKDPGARYRDCSEMREELDRLSIRSEAVSKSDSSFRKNVTSNLETSGRKFFPWKVVLALLAVLVLCAILARQWVHSRKQPSLTAKDTIVLADFTNNTGESVLADALKEGLSVDLRQSKFLNLLSPEEIGRQLRYMGRPDDQSLTPEIAREVCQRSGGKAALLSSVSKLGADYVITLKAVNCKNLDVLDEEQGEADRREKVLTELHNLGSRLRSKLGESLDSISRNDTPLQEATTPSLEALQAYSIATLPGVHRTAMDVLLERCPCKIQWSVELRANGADKSSVI